MRQMKRPPMLLLAILVYITLDFALPTMPGAFVFEPSDSVETVQTKIGRASIEVMAWRPLSLTPFVFPRPQMEVGRALVSSRRVTSVSRPPVDHLARGTLEPTASTEDPH